MNATRQVSKINTGKVIHGFNIPTTTEITQTYLPSSGYLKQMTYRRTNNPRKYDMKYDVNVKLVPVYLVYQIQDDSAREYRSALRKTRPSPRSRATLEPKANFDKYVVVLFRSSNVACQKWV
ncbi:hypothetical protein B7494_g877 [Chlorociboria aeruginascens]|nr:hypothetical protein B7494_g877 [Chlorociboria aeruginascens]